MAFLQDSRCTLRSTRRFVRVVYSCKVVTVQSDAGGSGVGNVYRLGWKEECVDDEDDSCEVKLLK